MTRTIGACLLLALVTIGVYWPVSHHGFVSYDDPVYVLDNPHVRAGLDGPGLRWAWTSTANSNWHPLTWISHMIDCRLFGVEHPGGHHLTSVMLHALNTLLLFLLFRQMTGAFWRPLFVAAVFALHPLHVESVAWISERKDVLSTLFLLLCIMSYVRYTRRPRLAWYGASIGLLALGLLCKSMLVTAPFLLLLLDVWPLRRFGSATSPGQRLVPLIVEKGPLFALAVIASVVTYLAQRQTEAAHFASPLGHRLATVVMGYSRYIAKTIWPVDLAVFYPDHVDMWSTPQVAAAALGLVAITLLVLVFRRKAYLPVGWFWFLGTLVPVIGFVSLGQQSMADRYMYLPMTGLLIMAAWGAADLCRGSAVRRGIVGGVAVAAVLGCLWLVPAQIATWHDSRALFAHAVEVTERNHLAHNSLGVALLARQEHEEATVHFREAVRVQPRYPKALYNLAYALQLRGELDEAVQTYRAVLELIPDDARAHQNLGVALRALDQPDQALDHFNRALELNPLNPKTLHSMASILMARGDYAEAIEHLQQALRVNPGDVDARMLLRRAEMLNGN